MNESQDKLVGRLKLDLSTLQKDITQANIIMKGLENLKIEPIDIKSGKESIKLLRLIEDELNKIQKQTGKDFGTDITQKLENDIKNTGVKLEETVIKTTTAINKNNKDQITSIKRVIETMDELGKKYAQIETEKRKYDEHGTENLADRSFSYKNITTNEAEKLRQKSIKDEIEGIKTSYNQLNTSGKERIEGLKKLNTQTEKLLQTENLQKSNITDITGLSKKYTAEINNVTNAQKKLNLETLKQVTAEKAQTGYGFGNKTMGDRLNSISGVSKNQTLGSGDARNKGFAARFSIAKDYVVASKIFNMAFNSIDDAYNAIKDYETGLVDLSRTIHATATELDAFGKQAIQSSKDFGINISEVQSSMTELARAGIDKKEDLESMTKSVLIGLNTTEVKSSVEMTGYLVSAVKQLGMSYQDTNKIIDSWNLLSDKYAVKSNDFAEAIQKSGSSSKALGIDLNTLNALVVTLGEQTQKSGSEIGNALKTLETRMLRPETVKTLEDMGISVKKDSEHFNSFQSIMTQVNQKMDEFGDNSIRANELMDSLGGAWRKNDITILANSWGQVDKIAKESMNSTGYSIAENEKVMNTLEKKVEVLKNTFRELFISFGESGVLEHLKGFITLGTGIINIFSKTSGLKNFILLLTEMTLAFKGLNALTKLISGQGIKQFLDILLPKFSLFSKYLGEGNAKMRSFQNASKSLNESFNAKDINVDQYVTLLGEMGKQCGVSSVEIDKLKIKQNELKEQLNSGKLTQTQYNNQMIEAVTTTQSAETGNKAYAASEKAVSAAKKSTLVSTLLLNAAMIGATILVSVAIAGVMKWIQKEKERQEQIKESLKTAQETMNNYKSQMDTISSLQTSYDKLSTQTNRTTEEQQKFNDVVKQMQGISKNVVAAYDSQGNAVKVLKGNVEDLRKEMEIANQSARDLLIANKEQGTKALAEKWKSPEYQESTVKRKDFKIGLFNSNPEFFDLYHEIDMNNNAEYALYQKLTDSELMTKSAYNTKDLNDYLQSLKYGIDMVDESSKSYSIFSKEIDKVTLKMTEMTAANESLAYRQAQAVKEAHKQYVDAIINSPDDTSSKIYSNLSETMKSAIQSDDFYTSVAKTANKSSREFLDVWREELKSFSQDDSLQEFYNQLQNVPPKLKSTMDAIGSSFNLSKYLQMDETEKDEYINHMKTIINIIKTGNNELSTGLLELQDKFNTGGFGEGEAAVERYRDALDKLFSKDLMDKFNIDDTVKNGIIKFLKDLAENGNKAGKGLNSAGTSAEQLKLIAQSFSDSIDKAKGYNDILNELNEGHQLSGDTIQSILTKYPELIQYLGDEAGLRSQLTTLIGDEDSIQKQYYYNMVSNDTNFYNTRIKNNGTFLNTLACGYKVDLKNATSLADAKIKVENALISTLGEKWAKYYSVVGDTAKVNYEAALKDSGVEDGAINKEAMTKITGAKTLVAEYNRISNNFKDIGLKVSGIDFKGLNNSKLSGGKTGKDNSSKNAVEDMQILIDKYMQLNNTLKDLENQLSALKLKEDATTNNTDKISILSQENELLNKKLVTLKDLQKAYEDEALGLKTSLGSKGFTFNATNEITNYESQLKKLADNANKLSGDNKTNAINDVEAVGESIDRFVDLVHNQIPSTVNDWSSLGKSIQEVEENIKSITASSLSFVESLQSDIISALQKQYEETKKAELDIIQKYYDGTDGSNGIISAYESRVEKLREELKALQDDMAEEESSLSVLEGERADWLNDDSVIAKGKVIDLDKEIAKKKKEIAIKNKQAEIELAEKALDAQKKLQDKEVKDVEEKYKKLLDEQNYYDEANKLLTTKNQDEIIKLLGKYNEKYKNMGKSWGKSLVDELSKTVKEGMSAFDFLSGNLKGTNSPSNENTPSPGDTSSKSSYTIGDQGASITKIQQALQLLIDNHLVQSGKYDAATASAVSKFQNKYGLKPQSGQVDEHTLNKLNELMAGKINIPHFYTGGMVKGNGLVYADDKEIILNKTDSANLLKTIDIARELIIKIPKFNKPDMNNSSNQHQVVNNFHEPLVKNEIQNNNNTPFDVENSNDNLARMMKKQLSSIGGILL